MKKLYRRGLVLICSGLLGLTLSVSIPVLSVERVAAPIVISQTTDNPLTLVQEGKKLYAAGEFEEAAKIWQQAAQAYETQKDKLNQAMALSNLSLTYQQLGKWNEATVAINKSLSLLPTGLTQDSLRIRAQTLDIQGRLQLAVGQSQQAADTWQQAAKFYAQLGDKNAQIQSQINQAQALQALGRYRLAKETLDSVAQTLKTQPDSALKASGLRSLGDVMLQLGELDESGKTLQESLEVAKKIQSPQEQRAALLSLGNNAQALAKRAKNFKDDATANTENQNALSFYKEAEEKSSSPLTKLQAQLNRLSFLLDLNRLSDARALLPQIQEPLAALPPSRAAIYAKINFAQSLTRLKELTTTEIPPDSLSKGISDSFSWSEISQILDSAVQQAQTLKDKRSEAYALGNLGKLYEKQGLEATDANQKTLLLTQAKTQTQQALNWAVDINANAPDIAYNLEWQMGRLLKAENDTQGAIAAYDTAFGTLKSLRTDLGATNRDVKFSFQENVEPVYRQYVELLLQADEPIPQNLEKAREVIDSLQVAELDNFFRDACSNTESIALDEVAKKYDPKSASLYAVILEKKIGVIFNLPNKKELSYYKTPITEKEVDKTVEAVEADIKKANKIVGDSEFRFVGEDLKPNEKELQKPLKQMYDWLIPPAVQTALTRKEVETLVFVLDGSLQKIPMGALYDGNNYLIKKARVALSLGLRLLDPKPRGQLKVLAAGLSDAPNIPGKSFDSLPDVANELLSQIKPNVPTTVLLNKDFTITKFQQQINSTFNVVHLATHGKFSSNPDDTFIVTKDQLIKVKELDNLLRISDKRRNAPIELLVLSACETATGDRRAALGLAGMAVQAGARSTIASLWNTADPAAAALMGPFYKALKDAKVTKAEALGQTQLDLLNNPKYNSTPEFRHPFYWAPFVLVGNWL